MTSEEAVTATLLVKPDIAEAVTDSFIDISDEDFISLEDMLVLLVKKDEN